MPTKHQSAFQLKGSIFTLTVLQLLSDDLESLSTQLKTMIEKNPGFFQHIPLMVDLQKARSFEHLDFAMLNDVLRKEGFIPVAICGGTEMQHKQAVLANWAILNRTAKMQDEKGSEVKSLDPPPPVENFAVVITQPVRSGQQIYAQNKDLIVLSSVSPGAELIADGHIHVYGTLRGRALAGVKGNKQARIFCQTLEAELVSIAGLYWVNEEAKKAALTKGTQIYLEDERLHVVGL